MMQLTLDDALSLFSKLMPALSIIAAIFLGRRQLVSARRATAVTIAKNHHRELLETYIYNADIIFMGTTIEGLNELKKTPVNYRRYRWLVNLTLFSLQETYFAIPEDKHWQSTVKIISSIFKCYLISEIELPSFIRDGWDPRFLAFIMKSLETSEHPIISISEKFGGRSLHMEIDGFPPGAQKSGEGPASIDPRRRSPHG